MRYCDRIENLNDLNIPSDNHFTLNSRDSNDVEHLLKYRQKYFNVKRTLITDT